jgi:hypothetical protein
MAKSLSKATKMQNLRWFVRFLLLLRNDKWYASLFSLGAGRVTGDITPYYANLEKDRVVHIYRLMPNAKIIYLLRNPIHRLWSHTAMHFSRDGYSGLAAISEDAVREYLEKQSQEPISDYVRNLQTWGLYPERQLHVGFFDQLVHNPRGLYKDICRFLDVDTSDQLVPDTVYEKHNPGQYPTLPDRFARLLAIQFYEQIEQLHGRFDNRYTEEWLQCARGHL